MLKMKINNEEVVCDKEFTITKDILTTSSTTLKNCYPKSWEETKDYVNNFYFPKDFSKCIIYDEEKIPGIPGLTAEGTNINLTYDNTLEKEITKISGDTYQQTYTGKNLLNNIATTTSVNGITFTKYSDGTVKVNGTASGTAILNLIGNNSFTLSAGNYVLSGSPSGGSDNTYRLDINDGATIPEAGRTLRDFGSGRVFTLSSSITVNNVRIRIASGTTINNLLFKPMIEKGTSKTEYEPYVGGIPSPNPDYQQNIEVVTGKQNIQIIGKNLLDYTKSVNGTIGIGSTSEELTPSNNTITSVWIPCKPNTSYTISGGNNRKRWQTKDINGNITFVAADSTTITTNSTAKYLRVYYYYLSSGVNPQSITDVMINEGSSALDFEPYQGKSYEIDLAEYDNLFTSTLESGGISSIDGQNIDNEDYLRTKTYINIDGTKHYTIEFTKEVTMEVYYYLANNNYIGWEAFGGENKYTFYPENVDKIKIVIRDNTITTDDIMLTEGSDITPSKYIELCKIGEYQDYIYKENNKWYLYKEIGKVILDGSEDENWNYMNAVNNNYLYQALGVRIPLANYSNNYVNNHSLPNTATSSSGTVGSYFFNNIFRLRVPGSIATSVTNFKNWLSNNNSIVYYSLTTPTVTQITDVNLINQLENLPLYEGINNITMINGNLTSSIKIHYNYENPTTIIDTIFSGLVKNTGNISLNPRDPHYCSLQILDFKDLLSTGETLDFVINEKTVQEAIQMVVDEISDYGFQVGTINLDSANEVIGTYSTLNKTAYDVFQYLANITQSKWFTRMIDDNNIAIDFYDIDKLDTKDDIEYTEQYFENNNIVDISYNYSTKDYRNKQIMLSNEVFANIDYNDTIITDGYNKVFTIGNNIGVLKNLSLNGVPMSVGTSDDKDRGIIADFYYTVGGNIIESDSLISAGGEIEFTYTPLVKGRQIIVNDDEINRVGSQINRNGTISRYETRNDSLSAEELQNIGESYIKYKGKAEITLKVKTINNDLYNIGDMVYFQAPLNDLQVQYMVKKKTINVLATTGDIFYTYELSNTYNSENEINYFDNQRAKANGNISSNDYITRNIDIDNNATIIFNNLGIQEITATGDNLLDCALNSPFNN